ncbi:hypothetical protein [Aquimarina sediminis]|uniref:hypothetical protein n=1 Tax=Aquimarina sediminis TaxID=2070536 RepID=UPI000CA06CDF|nr:hypothetical protein [Aquimarina sediminis]
MKCQIDINNKKGDDTVIVRRKFVPIKFNIHRENQFLSAASKLPFTTSKVIGVLTTTNVKKQCSDTPFPTHRYYGVAASQMEDTSFLETNPGEVYTSMYPPDVIIEQQAGGWWYYAHPVTDIHPFIVSGDFPSEPRTPKLIDLKAEGQCNPEPYYLWSERFYGYAMITFNVIM